MSQQQPLVSILTPSYNQGQWLQDNLDSVRNQTYENIEHIVMDGGSTDGSCKILQQTGPLVRWWSETDRGQSHALNKAFRESSGEIVGWLNSDDAYVDRRSVAAAVEAFDENPDVGLVFGHGILADGNNNLLHFRYAPAFSQRLLPIGAFFVQPSVFVRRSLIEHGFVDEDLQYVMDRDLWLRLNSSTRFLRIPCVVGLDRWQPNRKTTTSAYMEEVIRYDRSHEIATFNPARLGVRKVLSASYRWVGTAWAMRLSRDVQPAIDVEWGDIGSRLIRQIFTPRRRMVNDHS